MNVDDYRIERNLAWRSTGSIKVYICRAILFRRTH